MRLHRFGFAALVGAMGLSCEGPGPNPAAPSWIGVYSLRADTVRYCVENVTPAGRTCDCTAPGFLQGTLTLSADKDAKPTGEVRLRECPPGAACGAEVSYPVIAFNGLPNPNPPPGERLHFCAGVCPFGGNNGGIQFEAAIPANPLVGHFSRADGNVRGCGSDYGLFTATKP